MSIRDIKANVSQSVRMSNTVIKSEDGKVYQIGRPRGIVDKEYFINDLPAAVKQKVIDVAAYFGNKTGFGTVASIGKAIKNTANEVKPKEEKKESKTKKKSKVRKAK